MKDPMTPEQIKAFSRQLAAASLSARDRYRQGTTTRKEPAMKDNLDEAQRLATAPNHDIDTVTAVALALIDIGRSLRGIETALIERGTR